MTRRLFFVAGEPSGDSRAAGVCRSIRELAPDVLMKGVGGAKMEEAGVELVLDMAGEGVVGLWEVLNKLHFFAGAYRRVLSEVRQFSPHAVVLVDFPGFNLKLAEQLSREGFPIIYYVSPQVWAWRKYRIKRIRRFVNLMLVLFQFEQDLYREYNVPVEWVGHPLVDEMETFKRENDADEIERNVDRSKEGPVIGLLPGSRASEFSRHYPRMIGAVRELQNETPVNKTFVPVASELNMEQMKTYRDSGNDVDEEWISGRSREVMFTADLLLTASGTTTLEAAMLEKPMVVCYRVNPLTWAIGLMLIETEHIALVNLVAQERIVPECIQWDMTPARLSRKLRLLLDDRRYRECREKLAEVRGRLGSTGASRRAAEAILNFLGRNEA